MMRLACIITLLCSVKNVEFVLEDVRLILVLLAYPSLIIIVTKIKFINKILSLSFFQYLSKYTIAFYVSHGEVIHIITIINILLGNDWSLYSKVSMFWTVFTCCVIGAISIEMIMCFLRKHMK